MAASAPAKVNTYSMKIWPKTSSKSTENIAKLKLTANNINSIDTKIIIIFFRVINMPKMPRKKIMNEKKSKKKMLKLAIF